MNLTAKNKAYIDSLDYEELLRKWRFSPLGSEWFQGDTGMYWSQRMATMRPNVDHVAISQKIGWEKPEEGACYMCHEKKLLEAIGLNNLLVCRDCLQWLMCAKLEDIHFEIERRRLPFAKTVIGVYREKIKRLKTQGDIDEE
jgi:hypothetical protein